MGDSIPRVLVPLVITDSMITASTLAEPAAGETAWVSGGAYAVGDRRIRTQTHRIYECSSAHTGITTAPESDPNRCIDIAPTAKMAAFDNTTSTQSTATDTLSYTLKPGFFNAVALYKLTGGTVGIVVKDAPAGNIILNQTSYLDGPYTDEYDYCWGPYREKSKLIISGLLPFPDAEITITVSGTGTVGIGMVAIGDLRPLIIGDWGGTEYGAKAEPVDFSYIKLNDFGDTTIVKRRNATDMSITAMLPQSSADYALAGIQEVLAIPAAWVATTEQGYDGLNVFGLGKGSVSYDGHSYATLTINVQGMV